MEREDRTRLSRSEGRRFAIPVGLAFLALSGVMLWRGHEILFWVFAAAGGAFVLAGLLVPSQLGPVYRTWMGLALAISRVTTPIFMAIVYFLVITPTGLVMRLLGHNPLHHKQGNGSYWVPRDEERGDSDLQRQF